LALVVLPARSNIYMRFGLVVFLALLSVWVLPNHVWNTGGPKGWPGYAVAYPKPALFYPNDFFNLDLIKFKLQLNNYIGDSRHGNNFKCLTNHGYLSVKLVQTERNKIYDMVYNLLKLVIDFSKN